MRCGFFFLSQRFYGFYNNNRFSFLEIKLQMKLQITYQIGLRAVNILGRWTLNYWHGRNKKGGNPWKIKGSRFICFYLIISFILAQSIENCPPLANSALCHRSFYQWLKVEKQRRAQNQGEGKQRPNVGQYDRLYGERGKASIERIVLAKQFPQRTGYQHAEHKQ